MRKKLGALSRKMPTSRLLLGEICIEWSTTLGGVTCVSPVMGAWDVWYTTMVGFSLAVMNPALAQLA